jgi:hypothetical protein
MDRDQQLQLLTTPAASTMLLYYRFKIDKKDLRRQMNDTATPALKAGRLLVGTNTTENRLCGMHVMELVINHASGFIDRRKGGRVSDSFPACNELKNRVRICAMQFANRKAKGRIEKFNAFCKKSLGYLPIKVPMPNKTRVAGNFRMMEGLLRNYHAVSQFVSHNKVSVAMGQPPDKHFKEELFLQPHEWQQLAEFTAIYTKTTSFAIALQADTAASLSIAKLQLTALLVELAGTPDSTDNRVYTPFEVNDRQVVFDVVMVNTVNKPWTPQTPFSKLPVKKMCLPLVLQAEGDPDVIDDRKWNVDGEDQDLPTMTQDSRKLITRIMNEVQRYFKKTTNDEKVCMFLNPFVKVFGIAHLSEMGFFGKDFEKECKEQTQRELINLFGPDVDHINNLVQKEHAEQDAQEQQEKRPEVPGSPHRPLVAKSVKAVAFQALRRKLQMATTPRVTMIANMSLADKQRQRLTSEEAQHQEEVKRQLAAYEEYLKSLMVIGDDQVSSDVKWMNLLRDCPSALGSDDMKVHGDRVLEYWDANDCPFDTVFATQRFDIIRWWLDEYHGGKWPLLQALAVVHLSQPFTNAAIERVFSRTTWVDAARSQRVLDTTFEMRVLDADNRELVEKAKPLLDAKEACKQSMTGISETMKRFAVPIFEESDEQQEEERVVDDDEEISVVAAGSPDDDDDDSESGTDNIVDMLEKHDESIFGQLDDPKFGDEVNGFLRSKVKDTTSGKKQAASSAKKKLASKPGSKKCKRGGK